MNTVTPGALQEWLTGNLDWTAGTINVLAVDTGYTFSDLHAFLDDVPGGDRIGEVALAGRTAVGGVLDANDSLIPSAGGEALGGLWVYVDTGVEATSRLLFWIDTNEDGTPVSGTTTPDGINVPWSSSGVARFAAVP